MLLFGLVFLKVFWEERIVIVISCYDNLVMVLMIFVDLDVNVFLVYGVVIGDKKYVRFCREIYDGIEFIKVDFFK